MLKYIEPFVSSTVETFQEEDGVLSYFDVNGNLLAEVYTNQGHFYSAVFFNIDTEQTQAQITKLEAENITKKVQSIFQLEDLVIESIKQNDYEFNVSLRMLEQVYQIPIHNSSMDITISNSGFVESITLPEKDFMIHYPEKLISKEEASSILKQQPLLKLGIAPELGWQYVYRQNYDIYGVDPDGTVRLWSQDETLKDAGFESLPEVEDIDQLEAFIQGGRSEPVETEHTENEKQWNISSYVDLPLEEDSFIRACKIVKNLVGEHYKHYYVERYPYLKEILQVEGITTDTYRFVYILKEITFDFQAISISVDTETNQIISVTYPIIPFERFSTLPLPTITEEEANAIAQQLVDVELTLESDIKDRKKLSFVYQMDYPTSPTKGHIQYVDAFTGEIHWVETGW